MSDTPQGPGWWQASDDKWYPPEQFPGATPPQPAAGQVPPTSGYGMQPGGYAVPTTPAGPRNEPLAVASMVSSIVGLVLVCCWIGILGTIAGVVMGVIARQRIRDSNGMLTGDGMALAGIIVGAVGTVLGVGLIVLSVFANVATWNTY